MKVTSGGSFLFRKVVVEFHCHEYTSGLQDPGFSHVKKLVEEMSNTHLKETVPTHPLPDLGEFSIYNFSSTSLIFYKEETETRRGDVIFLSYEKSVVI